jgi:glycosyltransferase involved in cell wall biosynthesis
MASNFIGQPKVIRIDLGSMITAPVAPLRLGVVSTSFPQHQADPAGSFVQTHLLEWVKRNPGQLVDVVAVGPHYVQRSADFGFVYRVASRGLLAAAGAPESWEAAVGLERVGMAFESLRLTLALCHEVRTKCGTWMEVQSHWLVPSAVAVALGAPHLRHTAFVHSADVAVLESLPAARSLLKWLLPKVARVVCVSQDLAQRLRKVAGDAWPMDLRLDVEVMPVAPNIFDRSNHPRSQRNGVLAVGRLVPIKGFDVLLLAVAGLPRSLRPKITLLGEGPQRPRLKNLATRLNLEVDMPGAVTQPEVAASMSRAAVCVVPSRTFRNGRTEGFPLVAAEAIRSGTPLIASRTGGLAELEHAENVHLVTPGDPAALRTVLAQALSM